jgi:RNA polymerase sigma-70 factor, ECF subfamily
MTAGPDVAWLHPLPDAVVGAGSGDPSAVVVSRETLRLALVATLQHLPPQQRAVLLMRDVLAIPAAEVADMLGISVAAVKSGLQRARARIKEAAPAPDEITEPNAPQARALLEQYIAAFENADTAMLERALRQDAALEMVGSPTWFAGRTTCVPYISNHVWGSAGDWRMLPITANGQPGAAAYRRDDDRMRAFGIAVLTVTTTGIGRIVVFGDPRLVTMCELPEELAV